MEDMIRSSALTKSDCHPQYTRIVQIINLLRSVGKIKNRNFKMVTQLVQLLQQQPFFISFATNYRILFQIAKKIQYTHFQTHDEIYKMTDLAQNFYILMKGVIHLTVPEEIEPVYSQIQEQNQLEQMSDTDMLSAFLQIQSLAPKRQIQKNKSSIITQANTHEEEVHYEQKIIKVIESGSCFGEMMGERSYRATNAVAKQRCEVLILNKKSYECLLQAQLRTQNRSKFLFLSELPLFQQANAFAIERLCVLMQEKHLMYGQSLFKNGEIINKIYIVRDGQFKLMRKISKQPQQTLQKKIKDNSQYRIINIAKKQVPYRIIQAGYILGDAETLSYLQYYQQMCICNSQEAIVLQIDKKQFFKILIENQERFACMKELIQNKNSHNCSVTSKFIKKRTRYSYMNIFLSDQPNYKRKQFVYSTKKLSQACNNQSIQSLYENQNVFFNQLNKTICKSSNKNRFSINKVKCRTQSSAQPIKPPIFRKKTVVPHCVKDIVELVRLKAIFQKRFRKDRKKQKSVFKFNANDVPLFIKSRFNKIANQS